MDDAATALRVLLMAPILDGGVAAVLRTLIPHLETRGVRCAIFGVGGKRKQFANICSLGAHLGEKRLLLELLLGNQFDIAHFTDDTLNFGGLLRTLALPASPPRTICTSHTSAPIQAPAFPADAFTAVSSSAAKAFSQPTATPVHVIPNAPDTDVFFPRSVASLRRRTLLWVGRTLESDWEAKDVLGFLHLAATLPPDDYDLVLVDTADRSETLGLDSWLAGRVDYRWGLTRQQMAELYCEVAASGGAWISTSRSEGMPMCLLEAWACGCPAIVPRSPGFEFVTDEANGLVYERREAGQGVRRCLERLACGTTRERIVEGGLAAVRGPYSPAAVAERYLELYGSLASARRKGPGRSLSGRLRDRAVATALRTYNAVRPPRPPEYAE